MRQRTLGSIIIIIIIAVGILALGSSRLDAAAPAGNAKAGKAVYTTNCVACHAPNGDGKGAAAAGLNPKPRNFRDKKLMAGKTDAQLLNSIMNGTKTPGSAMPPWKGTLTNKQIHDVLAYIRTFSK